MITRRFGICMVPYAMRFGDVCVKPESLRFWSEPQVKDSRDFTSGYDVNLAADYNTSLNLGSTAGPRLTSPHDVVVDSQGRYYIADHANNVIRRMQPTGEMYTWTDGATGAQKAQTRRWEVVTFAGSGVCGHVDNADPLQAQFNGPTSLCIDASDNLFVTDLWNHCIRKITPAGVVTTLAGAGPLDSPKAGWVDATGTAARFNLPRGTSLHVSTGDLYIADSGNDRIRKVTQAGVVTTVSGSLPGFKLGATGHRYRFPVWVDISPDGAFLVVSDHYGWSGNTEATSQLPANMNSWWGQARILYNGVSYAPNANADTNAAFRDTKGPQGIYIDPASPISGKYEFMYGAESMHGYSFVRGMKFNPATPTAFAMFMTNFVYTNALTLGDSIANGTLVYGPFATSAIAAPRGILPVSVNNLQYGTQTYRFGDFINCRREALFYPCESDQPT